MILSELINIREYPVRDALTVLLKDKTTRKNIIWATDTYTSHGLSFFGASQITRTSLLGRNSVTLQPRIEKAASEQQERTRKKAEIFTPVWLCNRMNNDCDEQWFGRRDVFNIEQENHQWRVIDTKVDFPKGKTWMDYVDSRRLEITCGEAPYLASRYDAATGKLIQPLSQRIGILDRKLRIVDENTNLEEEWLKWAIRAFQASYGYEYQGDNLLIARINLLMTFCDYYKERWGKQADKKLLKFIANIISWNLWQMDGLKGTVPLERPYKEYHQQNLFEYMEPDKEVSESAALSCRIFNWRTKESLLFKKCKEM